jgi:hypothetical protein
MKVLDLLRGRQAERHTNNADAIAAAARKTAAGETVDHLALEHAMVEEGLSVEDFAALVGQAERRQSWRAAMDKLPAATARVAKTNATIERERVAFEAVRDAWFQRANELDAELAAAEPLVRAGNEAREKLSNPANVPGVVGERLAEALADQAEAVERVAGVGRQQREWGENLSRNNGFAERHNDSERGKDYARLGAQAERRLAELAAELADANTALAAAQKNLDAWIQRALVA